MSVKLYGGNQYLTLNWWNFPAGERGVRIENPELIQKFRSFMVYVDYESDQDFIDMLLLVNACRNEFRNVGLWLNIPYFPYARQDRVTEPGVSFSLQVAVNLVKMCNFDQVRVIDPHSDVLAGMFEPGVLNVVPQWSALIERVMLAGNSGNVALVAPDAGALKKIYPLAQKLGMPVIEARKVRDVLTGKIVKTELDSSAISAYNNLIVVDDICDGGATFIELAKAIRASGYTGELSLVVSHGIFSKGIDVINEWYTQVYFNNDMRKVK